MSYKATAFVKKLRGDVTRTEKFLLMVLADYHNSTTREAWPSVKTLSEDCMMSERTVERTLAKLEGRFLLRTTGCGRGRVSGYKFIGLDMAKGDKMPPFSEPQRATQRAAFQPEKGDIPAQAIRKEQVEQFIEPEETEQKIQGIYAQRCDFFIARKKSWKEQAAKKAFPQGSARSVTRGVPREA